MREMRKTRIILTISLGFLFLFSWSGCLLFGVRPVEDQTDYIRTLAVFNFDGEYGETIQAQVCEGLNEIGRLECVDVTGIASLRQSYDTVDSPEILAALQKLNTDGVVSGRVIVSMEDSKGTETVPIRVGTGRYKKVRDPFVKSTQTVEIMRTVLRPLPYIVRRASVTVLYKMVNVKTGRIMTEEKVSELYEEKFGGTQEYDETSPKKLSHLPPQEHTMKDLSQKAAAKLIKKIVDSVT